MATEPRKERATYQKVANAIGVDQSSLHTAVKNGRVVMPKNMDFDVKKFKKEYHDSRIAGAYTKDGEIHIQDEDESEDKASGAATSAKLRQAKLALEVQALQLKHKQASGELVPLAELKNKLVSLAGTWKMGLTSVADSVIDEILASNSRESARQILITHLNQATIDFVEEVGATL